MELTIDNLKKIRFAKIAVFKNNKLVDIIFKDLKSNYCPYVTIGSDEVYDEEDVLNFFKKGKYYIYDAKLINKSKNDLRKRI